MPTNFPNSVDVLTNPAAGDSQNSPSHAAQHANANDAIEAIETYVLNTLVPAGAISIFAGSSAPTGYLICNGDAVSRTTYASLFAVIGTTYGSGNGSTTFNLPNLKGRVVVGVDAAQSEFDVLGETGGAKTNTHNHYQSIGSDPTLYVGNNTNQPRSKVVSVSRATFSGSAYSTAAGRFDSTDNEEINILQPYLALNYIIKA